MFVVLSYYNTITILLLPQPLSVCLLALCISDCDMWLKAVFTVRLLVSISIYCSCTRVCLFLKMFANISAQILKAE